MSVIIDIALPRHAFELGRILPVIEDVEYSLERIVPLGEQPVPFLRVHDGQSERLMEQIVNHPSVRKMTLHTGSNGDEIFSLDWDHEADEFLNTVREYDGHLLRGDSFRGDWQFRLEFPDGDSVSAFDEALNRRGIEDEVLSIKNPWTTAQGSGPGPTSAQREALEVAYKLGYLTSHGSADD